VVLMTLFRHQVGVFSSESASELGRRRICGNVADSQRTDGDGWIASGEVDIERSQIYPSPTLLVKTPR